MPVHGDLEERFAPLRDVLAANIDSGEELGAAVAVDVDGDTVVDLWGGWADAARTRPWEADTIVNVWSTTKEVTALAVLLLVERGLVDLDAPLATYWPEFGANGKEGVLVRHVMAHTSGVSGWEPPFTAEQMYDWEASSAHLAAQAPWWEPGTASGYHAQAQGQLLGELVRRTDGRSLRDFVAAELAAPLGVDLRIGVGPEDEARVAEIIPPPLPDAPADAPAPDPDSPMVKTLYLGPVTDATVANTPPWRRADLGALNGHTNARALARTLSVISRGGTVDGTTYLTEPTIARIFEEQAHGPDLVLGIPLRWGIGYGLPEATTVPYVPDERVCFWGGWGGSMTLMFPERRLTISYVMNKMAPGIIGSDRSATYVGAVLAALG